jgi:hypothetical protein
MSQYSRLVLPDRVAFRAPTAKRLRRFVQVRSQKMGARPPQAKAGRWRA